jgi:hypothetical protein
MRSSSPGRKPKFAASRVEAVERVGVVVTPRAAFGGQLRRAVERHPAHELRGDVVLGLAAGLPDHLIGLLPDRGGALGLGLDDRPQPPRQSLAAPRMKEDRIQHGAVDVALALVEGAVADAHRPGASVA